MKIDKLKNKLLQICWEHEKEPASEQQTKVAMMLTELYSDIDKLEITRKEITEGSLTRALYDIRDMTIRRLSQKGNGGFSSSHEILGIITEEYQELIEAVKSNDIGLVGKEILDIAVACHIALACIHSGTLDW